MQKEQQARHKDKIPKAPATLLDGHDQPIHLRPSYSNQEEESWQSQAGAVIEHASNLQRSTTPHRQSRMPILPLLLHCPHGKTILLEL